MVKTTQYTGKSNIMVINIHDELIRSAGINVCRGCWRGEFFFRWIWEDTVVGYDDVMKTHTHTHDISSLVAPLKSCRNKVKEILDTLAVYGGPLIPSNYTRKYTRYIY